jgi:hydroxyacylglutathione hydrolase
MGDGMSDDATVMVDGIAVTRIPMLSDNYAWLLREGESGVVAIIDPAEATTAEVVIDALGGRLDFVLLTHHHDDHIAGAAALAARYGAKLVGHKADAARLPVLDIAMRPGESLAFGGAQIRMVETSGHTVGHVTYVIGERIAAVGDTLFSLGCGRMFEGTAAQFYASLQRIAALPAETLLLCGHEYTKGNVGFALSVDPENSALRARAADVEALRARGAATLPVQLGDELATNPFLRARSADEFGRLRAAKDRF